MPSYEYKCNDCQKIFTKTATISEYEKNPIATCQYCGGKNVKRVFSGVTVITSKKS